MGGEESEARWVQGPDGDVNQMGEAIGGNGQGGWDQMGIGTRYWWGGWVRQEGGQMGTYPSSHPLLPSGQGWSQIEVGPIELAGCGPSI